MKSLSLRTWMLAVLLMSSICASAQSNIVFLTLTFTNAASNGNSFVLIGSTRTWTNNVSSSPSTLVVASNTTANLDKTNFFRHVSLYPFGSGATRLLCRNMGSNSIQFEAQPGHSISYTINGVWGYGVLSTSVVYQPGIPYVFPLTIYQASTRTAVVSDVVSSLGQWSTNSIPAEATSLSGFVNASNAQTIAGEKVFSTSLSGTIGSVSNGVADGTRVTNVVGLHGTLNYLTNGKLDNVTLSNGVNYGNAFRSPGSGANSEQFGTGAGAAGQDSVAFGNGSVASNTADIAFGYYAQAIGGSGVAIGSAAATAGAGAVAIGPSAAGVGDNGIAIGNLAEAMHNESIVIGAGLTTTAAYQILFGTALHTLYMPGVAVIGNLTNTFLSGTNHLSGAWSTSIGAIGVNDGANNDELTGESVFTIVAGGGLSSGVWTLDGLYPGWQGRTIRLINLSGYAGTIEHLSGLAATTNQITCPNASDITIGNGYSIDLIWNSGNWRALPSGTTPTQVGDLTVTGNITLTNTVWDDVVVSLDSRSGVAGAPPTMAAFAGPVYAWEFSGSDSNALYFSMQLPHRYKHGTTLKPHIHWTKTTGSASDVIWGLDYTVASYTSNFSATATTIYVTNTCPTSMQHIKGAFPDISGTGLSASALIVGKLYRLGNVDADNAQCWGLSFDIHFESDKLGSDAEYP